MAALHPLDSPRVTGPVVHLRPRSVFGRGNSFKLCQRQLQHLVVGVADRHRLLDPVPHNDFGHPLGVDTSSPIRGMARLISRYCSYSYLKQQRSLPQAPANPSALMGKACSLAIRMEMASNLDIQVLQQSIRPHRPMPPVSFATSRSPTCLSSTRHRMVAPSS